jgi:hypothetical protein
MKHYKFFDAESEFGEGVQYVEFDGEWATRQVECYGDRWFNVSLDNCKEWGRITLCDQPISKLCIRANNVIDVNEFEIAWKKSVEHSEQCQVA